VEWLVELHLALTICNILLRYRIHGNHGLAL
jgi:hypothetical protein